MNWFRKDADGQVPLAGLRREQPRARSGSSSGSTGTAEAVETPIGLLPAPGALDLDGLDLSEADLDFLLTVDKEVWRERRP